MPYYCTVPRCTSMAGKAKNVSFHQFPRDEELAKLWNNILKRGKPYTKYSKVCSLHFKPEDYTITSAGKNKGQWRTLRKDAIPSQNLPSDTPAPYTRRQSGAWVPDNVPVMNPQFQQQAQQLAQAIYMQTMLAMQAAGVQDAMGLANLSNGLPLPLSTEETPPDVPPKPENNPETSENNQTNPDSQTRTDHDSNQEKKTSYQCEECSKCFKDPDVFILHKRTHRNDQNLNGKENFDLNSIKPEMLKSNPILANLLKNTMERNIFSSNLFEKQLMVSFSNMNSFMRSYDEDCDNSDLSESLDDSNNLVIDENLA
ncbi:THAP domain-containing protein 11-like [Helicoverpa zea]|uniref:THAP domain-containing protein 11-like n=1 Tax=Helicoverpa zea TaxID=7113 RepID=UPI001F5A4E9A|nr:THAP domain-containing protein 11-like [Helicoverpa zea]